MTSKFLKVKREELTDLITKRIDAEKKVEEYKELLKDINDEVGNFTGKFLTEKGSINFGKVFKILMSLKTGGNPSKLKNDLGLDGIFLIKENIDQILKDE
tara:strand:- start:311 stop:610 length:300 start_codon:yes stop_codon:yes gene_type:complete